MLELFYNCGSTQSQTKQDQMLILSVRRYKRIIARPLCLTIRTEVLAIHAHGWMDECKHTVARKCIKTWIIWATLYAVQIL